MGWLGKLFGVGEKVVGFRAPLPPGDHGSELLPPEAPAAEARA